MLAELLGRADVDAIVTTGGTGVGRRDQTIGVVERRLDVPLPGFGELFRMLSWEQVGSGAMLSRAVGRHCGRQTGVQRAGVAGGGRTGREHG